MAASVANRTRHLRARPRIVESLPATHFEPLQVAMPEAVWCKSRPLRQPRAEKCLVPARFQMAGMEELCNLDTPHSLWTAAHRGLLP